MDTATIYAISDLLRTAAPWVIFAFYIYMPPDEATSPGV